MGGLFGGACPLVPRCPVVGTSVAEVASASPTVLSTFLTFPLDLSVRKVYIVVVAIGAAASTGSETMDLTEWVEREGITVEVAHDFGTQVDERGWEHHRYTLTVTSSYGVVTVPWRQGLGIETSPTETVDDVVSAMLCDAEAGVMSFTEFCGEFGYDTDSRAAYATWEECGRMNREAITLLGSSEAVAEVNSL